MEKFQPSAEWDEITEPPPIDEDPRGFARVLSDYVDEITISGASEAQFYFLLDALRGLSTDEQGAQE